MEMLHGQIFALYLFHVAEATDLEKAAAAIGGSVRSKFAPKPATPAYVSEKLKTLDDIYRFSVEHLGMVRGELLEMTIVGILLFELALFFMGIMT